ncbi:DUF1450 domain-containing protein [Paenibacillus wulumuqiensis]|uniref:DUF1450 domain-containing protein n=1 Tax=Paenibacillus wulumuqiensis TaxID=1567107 RepID=UPI000696D190|nr:DUF1450 domain-containing protein [Paenibacillus wulumuqiensis]
MKTIKYCSKNDRVGTKKVYQDIGERFPDIDQQRKSCLSECKTCRRQPFVKIGKKQMLCADSPDQLYEQLTALIAQSRSKSGKKSENKSKSDQQQEAAMISYRFAAQNKKELSFSLNPVSAVQLANKLRALQLSGKPKKMKAIRLKKSSSVKARLMVMITDGSSNQLHAQKNELILQLTQSAIQDLLSRLEKYIQQGEWSSAAPFLLERPGFSKEVQMYVVASAPEQQVVTG